MNNATSGATTDGRPPRPTIRPFDVVPAAGAAPVAAAAPVGAGAVQPIPAEYPRIVPYLCVDDAPTAIEFYCGVFGATERMRLPQPDGTIAHAELEIGTGVIMLSDEFPDRGVRTPRAFGGTPVTLTLYVEDVNAVFARAIDAGATVLRPLKDQFYGDRTGQFEDPFGHRWTVASRIENVSPAEFAKRAGAAAKRQP